MMTSIFLYFSNSGLKAELDLRSDEVSDLNNVKLQKMQAIDVLQAEVGKYKLKISQVATIFY